MNLEVKVITGARKREMRLEGSRLKVRLMARPVKGKANEELIAYIAEMFGVKRARSQHRRRREGDDEKSSPFPLKKTSSAQILQNFS